MNIAIQGELASFHHEAAQKLFGKDVGIMACKSFSEVFSLVRVGHIGLSAIENSIHGHINEVADLMEQPSPIKIFGETALKIQQNLIGLESADPRTIQEIYSHPVALAQCEHFLSLHYPDADRIEFEDTAAAVRHIIEMGDPTRAAVAGRAAAVMYRDQGAHIITRGIEDNAANYTRFVAIAAPDRLDEAREQLLDKGDSDKTSVVLTTDHTSGALVKALNMLEQQQLNMTQLVSRPVVGQQFKYKFYLDFEGAPDDAQTAIANIRDLHYDVVDLGSYKKHDLGD